MDGSPDLLERALEEGAALRERRPPQIPVVERQEVEEHHAGGLLCGEEADPGLGRVDAEQEGLEVQPGRPGHHQLAVDHAAPGKALPQGLGQLGEVAVERLQLA